MRNSIQACLLSLAMIVSGSAAMGQGNQIQIIKSPHIPVDAFGHLSVRVQQVMQQPTLKLVPWELVAAAGMDNFGVDPTAIERVDVIFGFMDAPQLKWCAVVTLTEEWKSLEGKKVDMPKLTETIRDANISLINTAPKQVIMGTGDYFAKVAQEPAAPSELARQVTRIGPAGLATLVIVPAPIRDRLTEGLQSAPPQSQATLETLLANMQMLALRLELNQKVTMPVVVESPSAEAAQKFATAWQQLLSQIFLESNLGTKGLGEIDTPVKAASVAYEKRFQTELVRQLTPTITGNRLLLRLDTKFLQLIQSSSFMPAINAAIVASERMR